VDGGETLFWCERKGNKNGQKKVEDECFKFVKMFYVQFSKKVRKIKTKNLAQK
jgi:hypothetical protein